MLYTFLFAALLPFTANARIQADDQTYEYIVVGSGPGGGPLAANLARNRHSVLLLDAGDDQGDNVNITRGENFLLAANDEKTRWDFWVKHTNNDSDYEHMTWRKKDGGFYVGLEPPKDATKLGIWYPRVGSLGGCATHNGLVVALPSDDDWGYIADITGDESWRAPKMRKYLKMLERNYDVPKTDTSHGFDGWLDISLNDPSWVTTNADAKKLADIAVRLTGANSSQLTALMKRDINADDPRRDQTTGIFGSWSHANKEFVRSTPIDLIRATVKANYPLTVQLHSLVSKVLFQTPTNNSTKPKAIGVEYLSGKYLYSGDPRYNAADKATVRRVYASREVIIAGGAFNSPQILKLSGIGPAAELRRHNIPVIVNLPGVGEKLADNYESSVMSLAARDLQGGMPPNLFFNFLKTSMAAKNRDIQMWCGQFSFEGFWPGFPTDYGAKQFECTFVHMNPRSQEGYVRLKSANPRDMPDINFKFWEKGSKNDLQAMYEAIQFGRKVVHSASNSSTDNLAPFTELHPCHGGNSTRPCSEAATKQYLRKQVYSHHATSTCAIGGDGDRMAVLDAKFRVRGTEGLRVVDASAFPKVPGAFPVLPTYLLSNKALEDILAAV